MSIELVNQIQIELALFRLRIRLDWFTIAKLFYRFVKEVESKCTKYQLKERGRVKVH